MSGWQFAILLAAIAYAIATVNKIGMKILDRIPDKVSDKPKIEFLMEEASLTLVVHKVSEGNFTAYFTERWNF